MKKILFLTLSLACIVSASQLFDRCSTCHGKKGEKHSLNLTKSIAGMSSKDVSKILQEYKSGTRDSYGFGRMMQGQTAKLSQDDINTLAIYIESLPVVDVNTTAQGKKEYTAEELFSKCGICHGNKGQKKSLGVSKKIAGMNADDLIQILEQYRVGKRDIYSYGSMMRGQATKLSHQNIKKLAKYIESLPPAKEDVTKAKQPVKKISQEEVDYNTFMDAYFRDSKDPNETFEAAKKKYEEHKKLKEKNE